MRLPGDKTPRALVSPHHHRAKQSCKWAALALPRPLQGSPWHHQDLASFLWGSFSIPTSRKLAMLHSLENSWKIAIRFLLEKSGLFYYAENASLAMARKQKALWVLSSPRCRQDKVSPGLWAAPCRPCGLSHSQPHRTRVQAQRGAGAVVQRCTGQPSASNPSTNPGLARRRAPLCRWCRLDVTAGTGCMWGAVRA